MKKLMLGLVSFAFILFLLVAGGHALLDDNQANDHGVTDDTITNVQNLASGDTGTATTDTTSTDPLNNDHGVTDD